MVKAMATKGTVSVEKLVLAQSYEPAALVNLPERKGLLTQAGVLWNGTCGTGRRVLMILFALRRRVREKSKERR